MNVEEVGKAPWNTSPSKARYTFPKAVRFLKPKLPPYNYHTAVRNYAMNYHPL